MRGKIGEKKMIKYIPFYVAIFTLTIWVWILIIDFVFDETKIGNAMRDKIIQKIKGEKNEIK